MTVRAIAGLTALNGLYLFAGSALLWSLRGARSWGEIMRLTGLGYLLGVAALGVTWSLALIAGIPFEGVTILVTALALSVGSVVLGVRRGWGRPSALRWPELGWRSVVTAAGIALTGVFLELLFRAGRLQGLYAFDAWVFWIPKAEAIYELGALDEQFFAELPGPTYPPLIPALDAAAFHAMGSADVVTLHLQYWFLAAGFVAAAAGILARHVPSWILWPFLVLVLVMPRVSEHLLVPQADFALQFFFCVAALLAGRWLLERSGWLLVASTILLAAGVLTKREGTLLAVCLLVAVLVASFDLRRAAWPRIALAGGVLVALSVPWRLWYRDLGITGELPAETDLGGRAAAALRLSLEVLLDPGLFSIVAVLGLLSVIIAAAWGSRRLALLFGTVLALVVLGGAWITASYPELPIVADEAVNPVVRYTAAAGLLCGLFTPLLLAGVWSQDGDEAPT